MDLVAQAKRAKADTEKLLNDAFGFLERDYNYRSIPIESGGGPYHQFTKRYHLGGRSVCFFVDYDHKEVFGMYFSPVDLKARQEIYPDIRYVPQTSIFLEQAMERKGQRLTWRKHKSFHDALSYYADLLQRQFKEEIAGDFSAYPAINFRVELVHALGYTSTRIGDFDELSAAESAALHKIGKASLGSDDYIQLTAEFS